MTLKPTARILAPHKSAHVVMSLFLAGVIAACTPVISNTRASTPISQVVMSLETRLMDTKSQRDLKAALEQAFVNPSRPDGLTMTVRVVNFSVAPAGFDFPRAPSYGKVIVTLTDEAGVRRARQTIDTHAFFPQNPEYPTEEELIADIVEDIGHYLKRLPS